MIAATAFFFAMSVQCFAMALVMLVGGIAEISALWLVPMVAVAALVGVVVYRRVDV